MPLVSFGRVAILAALLLGGATHGGFVSDALLELIALPLLLGVIWKLSREASLPQATRMAFVFCSVLFAIPLLQLVPLPPVIWTHLPGRAAVAEAYRLVDPDLPWASASLTPTDTAQAALSLIPAFAVFFATIAADARERRQLSLLIIAIALAAAFLGLAQIAQGPGSPLRPFAVTSNDVAVGLFANRNHFAASLYTAIVLAAAWAAAGVASAIKPRRSQRIEAGPYTAILLAGVAIAVLLVGVLTTRSRAGLLLAIIAVMSGLALAPWREIEWRGRISARAVGASVIATIALVFVMAQLSLLETLQRFTEGAIPSDRILFARNSLKIAWSLFPFGSGVGSFVPTYAMHETVADMQVRAFVNRAHNDFIETALETGIVGPLLIAVFTVWFVRTALRIWRKPYFQGRDVDRALGRAATIVVALIALHSLVDYPIRTGAIMAIVAFACGMMFEPLYAAAESSAMPLGLDPKPLHRRRRRSSLDAGPRPLRL